MRRYLVVLGFILHGLCYAAPHDILGISPDASDEQAWAAYRKMSLKYHPDKGGTAQQFKEVQNALEQFLAQKKAPRRSAGSQAPSGLSQKAHRYLDELQEAYLEFVNSRKSSVGSSNETAIAVADGKDNVSAFGYALRKVMAHGGGWNATTRGPIGPGDSFARYANAALNSDPAIIPAMNYFLNANIDHFLQSQPDPKELISLSETMWAYGRGRMGSGDPDWNQFKRTGATVAETARETAKTPEDFVMASQAELSHREWMNGKEGMNQVYEALNALSKAYAERFGKPPAEFYVDTLQQLPYESRSNHGMFGSMMFDIAEADNGQLFAPPRHLSEALTPEERVRIGIAAMQHAQRQAGSPHYQMGNIGQRSEDLVKGLLAQHPDLAAKYRGFVSGTRALADKYCAGLSRLVFARPQALPPAPARQLPRPTR